jgi:hypothetical protein
LLAIVAMICICLHAGRNAKVPLVDDDGLDYPYRLRAVMDIDKTPSAFDNDKKQSYLRRVKISDSKVHDA